MSEGLNPKIWGPHAWFFLDSVVVNYPEKPTDFDKQNHHLLFNLLQYVLPCEICRQNYKEHFGLNPINDFVLSSKTNLVDWIIIMHNLVRKKHNKKPFTRDEFIDYYTNEYSDNNNFMYFGFGFVVLLLLVYIWITYYRRSNPI